MESKLNVHDHAVVHNIDYNFFILKLKIDELLML